ncbi:MAG: ThiF family adenylyltransferase [Vicinamibacterales bacterium]
MNSPLAFRQAEPSTSFPAPAREPLPSALPPHSFYDEAFQRNLGLYTAAEQQTLRKARIAVAGVGGVGGLHLLALVRMGVGRFRIADLDVFDYSNLNRQFGATMDSVGQSKTTVMKGMALAVNPDAEVDVFDQGIHAANIDRFLDGVDVVVDGIDFFAFDIRRLLFQHARKRGLYVITAGPVGFGSTLQVFSPTGMSFDEYFGMYDGLTEMQKFVAFATGIAPAVLHRKYMDLSRIKLAAGKAPVVASSCMLSSGLVAHEAINVLLRKRPIKAVPYYFQFDAFLQTYKKGYLRWGARNPIQHVKRWILMRMMTKLFPDGHPAIAPDTPAKG